MNSSSSPLSTSSSSGSADSVNGWRFFVRYLRHPVVEFGVPISSASTATIADLKRQISRHFGWNPKSNKCRLMGKLPFKSSVPDHSLIAKIWPHNNAIGLSVIQESTPNTVVTGTSDVVSTKTPQHIADLIARVYDRISIQDDTNPRQASDHFEQAKLFYAQRQNQILKSVLMAKFTSLDWANNDDDFSSIDIGRFANIDVDLAARNHLLHLCVLGDQLALFRLWARKFNFNEDIQIQLTDEDTNVLNRLLDFHNIERHDGFLRYQFSQLNWVEHSCLFLSVACGRTSFLDCFNGFNLAHDIVLLLILLACVCQQPDTALLLLEKLFKNHNQSSSHIFSNTKTKKKWFLVCALLACRMEHLPLFSFIMTKILNGTGVSGSSSGDKDGNNSNLTHYGLVKSVASPSPLSSSPFAVAPLSSSNVLLLKQRLNKYLWKNIDISTDSSYIMDPVFQCFLCSLHNTKTDVTRFCLTQLRVDPTSHHGIAFFEIMNRRPKTETNQSQFASFSQFHTCLLEFVPGGPQNRKNALMAFDPESQTDMLALVLYTTPPNISVFDDSMETQQRHAHEPQQQRWALPSCSRDTMRSVRPKLAIKERITDADRQFWSTRLEYVFAFVVDNCATCFTPFTSEFVARAKNVETNRCRSLWSPVTEYPHEYESEEEAKLERQDTFVKSPGAHRFEFGRFHVNYGDLKWMMECQQSAESIQITGRRIYQELVQSLCSMPLELCVLITTYAHGTDGSNLENNRALSRNLFGNIGLTHESLTVKHHKQQQNDIFIALPINCIVNSVNRFKRMLVR